MNITRSRFPPNKDPSNTDDGVLNVVSVFDRINHLLIWVLVTKQPIQWKIQQGHEEIYCERRLTIRSLSCLLVRVYHRWCSFSFLLSYMLTDYSIWFLGVKHLWSELGRSFWALYTQHASKEIRVRFLPSWDALILDLLLLHPHTVTWTLILWKYTEEIEGVFGKDRKHKPCILWEHAQTIVNCGITKS